MSPLPEVIKPEASTGGGIKLPPISEFLAKVTPLKLQSFNDESEFFSRQSTVGLGCFNEVEES